MPGTPPDFFGPNELIDRLTDSQRPVVFLVGSALTMPWQGRPGVANVRGVIELVRETLGRARGGSGPARMAARRAVKALDDALEQAADNGARYQLAMQHLKARADGAASVNAVLRQAVLAARAQPTGIALDDIAGLTELERHATGWFLGPSVKSLGLLIAGHPERFARAVLTTNFDPLVEVAIRAAGGHAQAIEVLADGGLPVADPTVTSVVHLHGLWRSDTLHTPGALTASRPVLERALARLYEDVTLVVIGYGGWDDVLMQALSNLTQDASSRPDVLWCFYESDPQTIAQRYPHVLSLLGGLRERAVAYAGIDCNQVLPRLRERADGEGELIGRASLGDALFDAIESDRAIEIVGERHMGRSRLLTWLAGQAPLFDARAALVNAGELSSPTPQALLRKAAERLGCIDAVEAELYRVRAVPDEEDAARALALLGGSWLLIDDADALATAGQGFAGGPFFEALQVAVSAGELHWISAGTRPLQESFADLGRTAAFLQGTTRMYAGGLPRTEVESALGARLGQRAPEALALTGTLYRLVDRACQAEWSDLDEILAGLAGWAESLCSVWWQRPADQRALLSRIARAEASPTDAGERALADELCRRGLLVETADGLALNGQVWADYVRRQR